MAVFQISKIQLRRGKKNQGTGMPQLASGELAWAIDTQELYIGNGSVGEGAPAVGNTKILTNKDSLLSIAGDYQYKYDYELQRSTVLGTRPRNLQGKLDDGVVNARNFGILPSSELLGNELDQTSKLQQAVTAIANIRGILEVDPGEYQFSETIVLPNNIIINGYGKDSTIFKFTGTGIAFDTVENSTTQRLTNLTVLTTNNNSTCLQLRNVSKIFVSNIKLAYDTVTSTVGLLTDNRIGLMLLGSTFISNNKFLGLEFKNLTYGVYSNSAPAFNNFDNCLFEFLYQGIVLGVGSSAGANYNVVTNSIFDKITQQAIFIENGKGNSSRGNTFKDVGSELSGTSSRYSIIKFSTDGNSSTNDVFERQEYLESNNLLYSSNPYFPEVEGAGNLEITSPRKISLPSTPNTSLAFRLPLNNATSIKVDYVINSITYSQLRKGTLDIIVDSVNNRVQLSDDYEYIGAVVEGQDAVIFTATLETKTASGVSAENIRINYTNTNENDNNTFTYTFTILT